MMELPVRLRYVVWLLVLGSTLLLFIGMFGVRLWPWFGPQKPHFNELHMPLFEAGERAVPVSTYRISELSAEQLHRSLLGHFAVHSDKLVSDYEATWLTLTLELKTQQLSSLAALPSWPGWQLHKLSLLPKADYWSVLMRWQRLGQAELQGTVGIATNDAIHPAFDASLWQLGIGHQASAQPPAQQLERQIASALSAVPVDPSSWRYVGYLRGEQGIGAWLEFSHAQSAPVQYCFAQPGVRCGPVLVLAIDPQVVSLRHAGHSWLVPLTKSWRIGDVLAR